MLEFQLLPVYVILCTYLDLALFASLASFWTPADMDHSSNECGRRGVIPDRSSGMLGDLHGLRRELLLCSHWEFFVSRSRPEGFLYLCIAINYGSASVVTTWLVQHPLNINANPQIWVK